MINFPEHGDFFSDNPAGTQWGVAQPNRLGIHRIFATEDQAKAWIGSAIADGFPITSFILVKRELGPWEQGTRIA